MRAAAHRPHARGVSVAAFRERRWSTDRGQVGSTSTAGRSHGGVRGGDHVGVLELDGPDGEVLEETGAAAEEHGSQVDADLVCQLRRHRAGARSCGLPQPSEIGSDCLEGRRVSIGVEMGDQAVGDGELQHDEQSTIDEGEQGRRR